METSITIGKGTLDAVLLGLMANRHGLIAGATGTGKTVTLRVLAEGFSRMGVPVFMADVKGDLAGLSQLGERSETITARCEKLGILNFSPTAYPVTFWDVFGQSGHPVRTTLSEMGPLLLGRLLNLNDTQTAVLSVVFKVADDNGLLLLDIKDLHAMLQYVGEHASEFTIQYGNISPASVGAIQRGLLTLNEQGADKFFGEPSLNIDDLIQSDQSGKGVINILAAEKLLQSPKVYATFLLWLLSELFEKLPEAGDLEKPKLVFFFDEAHLLFEDTPKALLEKIEQVVRLIRSKGVGIYFVTQNPLDIPDKVLGQLGNRVQHALRAFTARDQKAVTAAAETFRSNPTLDTVKVITELAVGEALVSFLDSRGTPSIVDRVLIAPPQSRLGAISVDERRAVVQNSVIFGHYERQIDRESAYEKLKARTTSEKDSAEARATVPSTEPARSPSGGRTRQTTFEAFVTSTMRSVGSSIGRQIVRGLMGSLLGGRAR